MHGNARVGFEGKWGSEDAWHPVRPRSLYILFSINEASMFKRKVGDGQTRSARSVLDFLVLVIPLQRSNRFLERELKEDQSRRAVFVSLSLYIMFRIVLVFECSHLHWSKFGSNLGEVQINSAVLDSFSLYHFCFAFLYLR